MVVLANIVSTLLNEAFYSFPFNQTIYDIAFLQPCKHMQLSIMFHNGGSFFANLKTTRDLFMHKKANYIMS